MVSLKRFAALATSAAIAASMCVGLSGNTFFSDNETVKAADDCHDDWLHAKGNKIYDMSGNEVWLTGCNWFGYNVGSQVFDGVWSQNMHEMLNQIADHGFNLLRVPMSTEILLQWKNHGPDPMVKVNTYKNPELSVDGTEGGDPMYSFDIWNYAVKWCKENGIKIMIDIHCAETASAGHQVALWYTDKFSDEDWIEALEWVTDYYKDDDTLIALDLKNEPHGTSDVAPNLAKWDDSKDPNNWKYAAERAGKAVLDINPNLLIMVEGVEVYPKFEDGADWNSQNIDYSRYPYSYFHHTWWGGNFRGVKDYPVDLGDHQSQLVYSPHDYGPLVFAQTWFYLDDASKTFDSDTLMNDVWHDNWFFIQENGIAPLLMGEWGGFIDAEHDPTGDNTKWMICLRDLMIKNHINHTFWCFNENSGDTGGLVYDNFGKWDEDKYALVEPALWQDDNGNFISLDHQIKLGSNGISLTDHYSGNSTPKPVTTPVPTATTPVVTTTPVTTTVKQTQPPVTTTVPVKVTTVSSSADTTPSEQRQYGDIDNNGSVDLSDLLALSQHLLKDVLLTGDNLKYADINGNGDVDISDLPLLKQYIMKDPITLGPKK